MNEIYNWLISRQPDSQALRESGRTWGAVGLFLAALGAIPFVGLLVIAPGAKRAGGMLLAFVQQLPAWLFIAAPCVMMAGVLTTIYALALRQAAVHARNVHNL